MLRIILCLSISLIIMELIKAQSYLSEDIIFTSQTQIDEFAKTHTNCTTIFGNVSIKEKECWIIFGKESKD